MADALTGTLAGFSMLINVDPWPRSDPDSVGSQGVFLGKVAQKEDGSASASIQSCCGHISRVAGLCYNSLSLHGFLHSGAFLRRQTMRAILNPIHKTGPMVAGCRAVVLGLGLALVLAGCSTGAILADKLPEGVGGLPADAPTRPQTADHLYPAVHDMPPERSATPLSDTEQVRLEKELEGARDRLESKSGTDETPPAKPNKPKKSARPASGEIKSGEVSGATPKP
ncbi:MAG TPA: hypothetical protein VFC54_03985 [Pseudolabrys sp.]|nr:hypothetical protein [Pseudolabrys sp.]